MGKFWPKPATGINLQGNNCTIRFLETGLRRMYTRYKLTSSTPRSFFTKRAVCLSLCLNLHTIQYSN